MYRRVVHLALVVLIAIPLGAQVAPNAPHVPCPVPTSRQLTAGTSAPTPSSADIPAADFPRVASSVWNQTTADKHFAHTFHIPSPRECCLMTKGVLRVRIKALQTGNFGTSSSGNDRIHIFSNGVAVAGLSQNAWPNGATAGNIAVRTFNIPPAVLATGRVTFYVQDDTAVLSAQLDVSGCCIQKLP